MTKSEAIKLFGSPLGIAEALEISRQAVYQWPEELPRSIEDRVIGAATRMGLLGSDRDRDRTTAVDLPKADGDTIYLVKVVGTARS